MKASSYQNRKSKRPAPEGKGRFVMDSIKSHERPMPYIPKSSAKDRGPDSRGKTV